MTQNRKPTYLVTGGAGFIGSNLVHHLLAEEGATVVVFDLLTYAGNLDNLGPVKSHPGYRFIHGDICDRGLVRETLARFRPDIVFNLAAESHVDRSIDGPGDFIRTNIVGAFELLDAARGHFAGLDPESRERFRFIHVSTDEVYGTLGEDGLFTETTAYAPNSPYSASKAGADHLARAYFHTYGLPVITTNCSNNYGPYQFPEKLIPLVILNALEGRALPVYGDGQNVRDWLHVRDHSEALSLIAKRGEPGETYNIGGNSERTNLQVVEAICDILNEIRPRESNYRELIRFVTDRPGHDFRYAIDASKLERSLGFRPRTTFEEGLRETIAWYLDNSEWHERIRQGVYRGERLGLSSETSERAAK